MQSTKHNLSHNEVQLDYQALVTIAEIAVKLCKENAVNYLSRISNSWFRGDFCTMQLTSNYLKQETVYLEIACETLAALKGGETRENIIIVNKKEIQKESA